MLKTLALSLLLAAPAAAQDAGFFADLHGILAQVAETKQAQNAPAPAPAKKNDIDWVTKSIEYRAACVQTYNAAWKSLIEQVATAKGDWAVVLDIDETTLDNTPFQEDLFKTGKSYNTADWEAWVNKKQAKAVPGVKEYLDKVRTLGSKGKIVFITDRKSNVEQATIENLTSEGLFQAGDLVLTKAASADDKETRRQCVAQGTGRCAASGPREILELIGDNIRDILPVTGQNQADQLKKDLPQDPLWGKKYFILPNPMYGSWESDYK